MLNLCNITVYARGYDYAGKLFAADCYSRAWNCIYGCKMPTILFENCFVDNNEDCRWLMDGGYKTISQTICDGVRGYREG